MGAVVLTDVADIDDLVRGFESDRDHRGNAGRRVPAETGGENCFLAA